ncbi:MAG: isoleucine--tRNA ligase [Candidatus Kerfeldbacteria bacterium]|nr:isoleucine--tRNA ligase [Candidatus Kerfeldbacteria bacterium]
MFKFPELEHRWLNYWQEHKIFDKTLAKPSPRGRFIFFEGPPTANAAPALHHVLARAFKDLIPRYKTMAGFRVERKAGWDTQGLPVELQVEKELKFRGKPDIEKYGVQKFNAKCKEDVWKFKADWEKLTERIGFWLDLDNPYTTYESYYIESLWWILKQVYEAGLLYQGYKVVPQCPRCGTALSSHEVALGYQSVTEPAVFVKFKVKEPQKHGLPANTSILSWTTTPWTLPGNVALAVGENIEYWCVFFEQNYKDFKAGEAYIGAGDFFTKSITGSIAYGDGTSSGYSEPAQASISDIINGSPNITILKIRGSVLSNLGLEYEPLFDIKPLQKDKSYHVYAADFVTTTEGTGVVHTAVMYGEDDYELGEKVGLPKYHTVDENGFFTKEVTKWAGKFVKDKKVEQGIVADLKERGLLFAEEPYKHDYPFCWRCESPLLYYAKPSWFIKMSELREDLKSANEKINWYPEHIKHGRFGEWLEGVKDWAISRERYWGTPLPLWVCQECKKVICVGSLSELAELTKDKNQESRIKNQEFDIHRPFIDEITIPCECGGTMKRVPEVADCWFDSGSMPFAQWGFPHKAGSKEQLANSYPADFIAEAIDQTRGWFYTLLAVATLLKKAGAVKEIPPYKNVICLGHINDKQGQKMSKSRGNIIDPWEIIDKYGADALRWHLYTANQPGEPKNFDPQAVDEVVKKTLLILMNVVNFYEMYQDHAEAPRVAPKSDHVLDRWVLALVTKLTSDVTSHLERYEVTEAGRELAAFVTELSTWYVRRSRERFKAGGTDAGRARTTLGYVLRQLAILLAPFTPFVAEEVYGRIKGGLESVHLEDWPGQSQPTTDGQQLLADMVKARVEVEKALAQRAAAGLKVRQILGSLTTTVAFDEDISTIIAEEVNVQKVIHGTETKLDTRINEELKALGLVREFCRQVNALRKAKGLTINDRVVLKVGTDKAMAQVLENNREVIIKATLSRELQVVTGQHYRDKLAIEGVEEITVEMQ